MKSAWSRSDVRLHSASCTICEARVFPEANALDDMKLMFVVGVSVYVWRNDAINSSEFYGTSSISETQARVARNSFVNRGMCLLEDKWMGLDCLSLSISRVDR